MSFEETSSFLHTATWEAFLQAAGYEVKRNAGAIFVRGSLPNRGSYWRSSRLSLSDDWQVPTFASTAWFLRLEPLGELPKHLSQIGKVIETETYQPKQTVVIDLSQSEEELLAQMKSKHRYNIRVAERHGVQWELVSEESPAHFERFWKLLADTAGRKAFRTHAKNYYKKMIETLAPLGEARLAFATLDGEDLSGVLLITHDKTVTYLHGGSTVSHKEVMAPHLLHWHIMRWAKSQGHQYYDLWGTNAIKTEDGWEARANHPSAGTTRFKLGFGGEIVQYPGAFDLVLKPIPYTLYKTLRRIIRHQSSF